MKRLELCIASCEECPHFGEYYVMHEDNSFCELLGQNTRDLEKDNNGIPVDCPLEDATASKKVA